MNHHYGGRKELHSPYKFSHCVVSECEPKVSEAKGYALDQKDLKAGKDGIYNSRDDVHLPPALLYEVVLVSHYAQVKEDVSSYQKAVELYRGEAQRRHEVLLPSRVPDLQDVVYVHKT